MRPIFLALLLVAPAAGAQTVAIGAAPEATVSSQGVLVHRAAWDAVGRREANESAPEGPMSFATGPGWPLVILDQVNGRLLRPGAGSVDLGETTFQDVAVLDRAGHLAVLDRLAGRVLRILDRNGNTVRELPVEGEHIPEAGLVTALLPNDDGLWLEIEHTRAVQILDDRWRPVARRAVRRGRPLPGGEALVAKLHGGRAASVVILDRDGRPRREASVAFREPVDHLALVATDARGRLVVAATLLSGRLEVVTLDPGGGQRRLLLPGAPPKWEQFVELRLTPAGTLFRMSFTDEGVEVRRWEL